MVPHGGRFGRLAVTFDHRLPPSRVICTCPSLLHVQMTPGSFGDSAIDISASPYSGPTLSPVNPPEGPCRLLSFSVRSGLISRQLCPPSVVMCTYWLPAYTLL